MQVNTVAIVLKTMNYGESSIIVRLFTRALGYRSYIINGVRRKKQNKKAALYRPMNIVRILCRDQSPEKLQRIQESYYEITYNELPFDVVKSAIGLFCIEVLTNTLKDLSPHQELFDFVQHFYIHLDNVTKSNAKIYLFFLSQLTDHLGIAPLQNHSKKRSHFVLNKGYFQEEYNLSHEDHILSKNSSQHLADFLTSDINSYMEIGINRSDARDLLQGLIRYYQYHIENFQPLKSLSVLETIFSSA